ncbi:MAG: transcriptional repressor [Limnochordales bacterium]|nr:MAG: transcriptional repressor [Bacillota bacterium]
MRMQGGNPGKNAPSAGVAGLEQHILDLLEEAGHRLTGPRVQLAKAVSAMAHRPFSGEDLYEDLRRRGVGRATVFRTLKLLQDLGVLSRLHMEDGCQRYIVAPPGGPADADHRDRLICRRCGRVAYLDQCPMEESMARVAEQLGYHIESHHLDIVGLCADCHGAETAGAG